MDQKDLLSPDVFQPHLLYQIYLRLALPPNINPNYHIFLLILRKFRASIEVQIVYHLIAAQQGHILWVLLLGC